LEAQRQVTTQEGKELADQLGLKFVEASAKSATNVEKAFQTLATEIKGKVAKTEDGGAGRAGAATGQARLAQKPTPTKKQDGCCK
jgi:hypothetical protein